jgi:hypothetical protein
MLILAGEHSQVASAEQPQMMQQTMGAEQVDAHHNIAPEV